MARFRLSNPTKNPLLTVSRHLLRIAKGVRRHEDDDREPEPRKGLFRFLYPTVNKKQQKLFAFTPATIGRLARTDPITWSIIRTIKSFVNQVEWDIVPDTESVERELDRWEEYALSYLSPYAVNHTNVLEFKARYMERAIAEEIRAKLKKVYDDPLDEAGKRNAIKWCLASAVRRVREEAEGHRPPVRRIFEKPSTRGIESNFRALQELVIEDILIYDAGIVVKNWNRDAELAELYTLPGHEIKLYRNEDGTLPQVPEPCYVWEDKGIVRAEFTWDELLYIMHNPQANGYGLSPIEVAAYIITASLYADEYNIDYFKNSNVPPGVLDLGEEITEDQRVLFKELWENEVRGRGGQHRMMFISGTKNARFIPMRIQSNRDMQMMDYLKWTMAIKTACFGLSPQDIGFTMDFHRTTAETQRELSQARGVRGLLNLLRSYYNDEIVKKEFPFQDVRFEWQNIDVTDQRQQAEIDQLDIQNGVITRNERRRKLGLKPVDGGDTPTVSGQVIPVKQLEALEEGREDIEVAGTESDDGQSPQPQPREEDLPRDDSAESGSLVKVPAERPAVTLKVNRRRPIHKQHEVIHHVVKELRDSGVEATVKIVFDGGATHANPARRTPAARPAPQALQR